ncbi:hypothetical protein NQR71_06800, partial [Escherichia coli DSM 30083 = JCM 1649 = ATCC 11775]|nr:hypothetical protein [Escherichia coli DSM 30083 = JCM 1649 = ATCC 11775]
MFHQFLYFCTVDGRRDIGTCRSWFTYCKLNGHIVNDKINVTVPGYSSWQFAFYGNDSNLLIVFYVQIMPDDFVMQLHR